MSELLCKKKKKVHPSTVVAVKNLSLAVESGEVFGLLGHNGAGKTTAIRIIIAEETPTKGRVSYFYIVCLTFIKITQDRVN